MCGSYDKTTMEDSVCAKIKGKGKIGKLRDVKHMVLKRKPFQILWDKYYLHWIKSFKMHYWKIEIQGKRWLNLPCLNLLEVGGAKIEHHFMDVAVWGCQNQVQSTLFGGNTSLVKYWNRRLYCRQS